MNEATETSPLLLVRSNDELGVTGMSEYQRLAEIEAQLEFADTALQAAIGNMGKLAGSSRWIGSLHWWKRMVKTHLSLQHIKRQVARWNKASTPNVKLNASQRRKEKP